MRKYIALQVVLDAKLTSGSIKNLTDLEKIINDQSSKGYELHTLTTTSANGNGSLRDGKIQAIMIFEKI